MINESTDLQILARERRAIELLARETRTAIATVEKVFLLEYRKLAASARIQAYVPLLTFNSVRGILELWKSSKANLSHA